MAPRMCFTGGLWLVWRCVGINSPHIKATAQPCLPAIGWLCAQTGGRSTRNGAAAERL